MPTLVSTSLISLRNINEKYGKMERIYKVNNTHKYIPYSLKLSEDIFVFVIIIALWIFGCKQPSCKDDLVQPHFMLSWNKRIIYNDPGDKVVSDKKNKYFYYGLWIH